MRLFAGRRARRTFASFHRVAALAAAFVAGANVAEAQAPWTWEGYFEIVTSPGGPPSSPTPADGASGMSRHPLSQDGRFVVFETTATNLGAPQGASAIFRRDRITGQLTIVQMGFVRNAAISADGWHVAYEQCGSGFASPCQVYARDLRTSPPPMLLSSTASGISGNGDSLSPTLSQTGRYVVYVTNAQNLSNDPLRRKQIMWRDRDADADGIYDEAGAVTVQSMTVIGATPGNGDSDTPEVSDDGRFVAFRSAAANLVGGDTNAMVDVFLRDRSSSSTRRLNLRPGNVQSPFPIAEPHISMSGNGQFVAFASADPFLTSSVSDTNAALDVFLYQGTPTLLRVDVGRSGSAPVPGNGPTGWATLNNDGRYVSLQSAATNAPFLSPTGSVQIYAVDRQYQTVTRISGMPDGTEPDASSVQPSITGGGSLVVFSSSATTFTGVPSAFPQIHAAARLNVTPSDVHLMIQGGQSTVRIAAHSFTRILPYTDPGGSWLQMSLMLNAPDNNMLTLSAPENHGPTRTATVRIGTRTVTVTQDGNAMEALAVWPTSGPMSGGTPVTIQGYGFTPDSVVSFGGIPATTTFVDLATLSAVTPAFPMRGAVSVTVAGAEQVSTLENAFMVFDDTPPVLSGIATGPQGPGGWFTGDVTVTWTAVDEHSAITASCGPATQTTDTAGTTFTCIATSEGGSTVASVVVKRDTTPPVMTFASPYQRQLVEPGAPLTAVFSCTDPLSGVADCGPDLPSGTALDTTTPGWHTVTTSARDALGHARTVEIEYAVSAATCSPLVPGTRVWLRFDGTRDDVMNYSGAFNDNQTDTFVPGVSGQAYRFSWFSMESQPYPRLNLGETMAAALWIRIHNAAATMLLHHNLQFRLQRNANGTVTWALKRGDGAADESGTSVGVAPTNAWTHVALTYDRGSVALYLNGRVDGTWTVPLPVLPSAGSTTDRVRIGGPAATGTGTGIFLGAIDEVRLFDQAVTAADIETIFLSGAATSCLPKATVLTLPSVTTTYGTGTYPAVAILTDVDGQPIAGKAVQLEQIAAIPYGLIFARTMAVTDASGVARWDAPYDVPPGTYFNGLRGYFPGDHVHAHSTYVAGPVFINPGPSEVTWTTPAPITYGTALSATQLNAAGNMPGTFTYTPAAGTVPAAGLNTLRVTFRPTNTAYGSSTTTVPLEVAKGVATMSVANTTVTYNGLPRMVTATARDYRGFTLSPVTVTYDGATTAPSAAGVYTVVADFAGDANHQANSATATLTITKAAPTIAFSTPASFTYDGQPHGVVATVTGIGGVVLGTVPVTYQGLAGMPVDAGSYVASATFDGNDSYTAGTGTTTVTIARALPALTYAPQPATFTYDGQPHTVTTTVTGIGGIDLGPGTVSHWGGPAPVDVGLYSASIAFEGNANYLATSRSLTITIQKATPTIVFAPQPTSFTYDGQGHALTAAVVGVAGANLGTAPVSYSGAGIPPVAVGTYTASATFGGNANYTSHTATTPITITGAVPLVTISGGPFVFNGVGKAATVTVTGVGGQTVSAPVTVTYDGGAALPVNAGTYAVVATVAASGNYAGGSGTGTLVIEPATPPIYWSAPAPITYGTPLDNRQLGAYSSVTGTWTYTPAAGTVLDVGLAQTLTVSFTPTDPNYVTATATRTIDVQRATAFISIAPQFFNYDGQPHPSTMASAHGAGYGTLTPITLTYDGSPTPPVNAGTYTVVATFEGDERFLPASGSSTLTINKAQATISWSAPVSLTYGTPLGPEFFTATADIPGTFTYTPEAGTILDASYPAAHTIRANFTPADSVNYAVQSYPRPVWVYRAMPTVRAFGGGFVYDGQPHAGSGTAMGVGGVALTPVTVTYNDSLEVPVAVGSYTVRATFEGNANYSSNSHATTLVISRATATVALTGGTFTYDGQPHAATASATGAGGVTLTPVTVTYNGAAAVPVAAGSYNVVATFAGDANHASASANATITIGQAVATLSWNAPASIGYGTPLGAAQLNATASVPGTFTYTPAAGTVLAAGSRPLSATFTPADPANYSGGSVATTVVVLAAPLTVRAIDAAKVYGAALPGFAVSFSGLVAGDTPASLGGALAFATAATSSSPVGTYAVTPSGLSSPNYTISFANGSLSIVKAPVVMTITASPTPSGLDMPITLTATVAAAQAAPTSPAGTVRFFDGTTLLGTATLSGGTATLLTGGLTAGSHTIEARYDGDASFDIGSRTATHVVNTAAATPAITLTTSRQPATTSQSMVFTATITVATSGSIAFYDGGTLLGSGAIAAGRATLTVASLAAGSHAITARFQGNASAPPVISPVLVQSVTATGWKDRTSTLALVSSANPSALGAAVTFTATASGSSGTPTGSILFMVDGLVVGSPTGVPVSGSGQASVSLSTLNGGRHKVTATYLGSSNYRGSSAALTQIVN